MLLIFKLDVLFDKSIEILLKLGGESALAANNAVFF